MKITFLCGSLEPGRNGVGDYTRLLAAEVIRQGHQVNIIALNDQQLTTLYTGSQQEAGLAVSVVRLPASWTAKARFSYATSFIDTFKPELISLQFVPFSFHEKGLLFQFIYRLSNLGKGRQWHIMFHELWVWREPGTNWKRPVYATLQKLSIKLLVSTICPSIVHTHLPIYYRELRKLNQSVQILPLFSNIPVVENERAHTEATTLKIGVFNQIRSNPLTIDFIRVLLQKAGRTGLSVQFTLIGSNESKLRSFGQSLAEQIGFNSEVNYVGFLEPAELSIALQRCTIGLTSLPRHILGKSGSVAAFIAHGIPVAAPHILPNHDAQDVGFQADELKSAVLLTPDIGELEYVKKAAQVAKKLIQVETVATTFINDVQRAVKSSS